MHFYSNKLSNSFLLKISDIFRIPKSVRNQTDLSSRFMRVKYKEKNYLFCPNFSDVSLAMGFPTSSGFIKLKKTSSNEQI